MHSRLAPDTHTSVLPEVGRKAAEDVATLIIQAGACLAGPTATRSPRRPDPDPLLAGHNQTATTELVCRYQIVPALTRGAEVIDEIFG
jgi:hypothetical protein